MKKTCMGCGEIITGRIDKKFCCDQCRNNFNNKLNSDANNYVRNVNNILRKNRRILEDFKTKDKATVHREQLIMKGFNFQFFTSVYNTKAGKTYYFCYEYGFLPLGNDFYALVLKKEYSKADQEHFVESH
jgi:hypothetical protein